MTMTRPTTEQITHEGRLLSLCLADTVDAKEFGAVGDGVADDTVAIKAAFDYAIPLARPVVLQGTYRITGPISSIVTRTSGELHIICNGNVRISVDAASTPFYYVLFFLTTPSNNVSITGGTLDIDCNQRAAFGIRVRHLAATQGGTCSIRTPVTVRDCYQHDNNQDAAGIQVLGEYERIDIVDASVIGVGRTATGVCTGISISEITGTVSVVRPFVSNVLHSASQAADADGISIAGKPSPSDALNDLRLGRVVVDSPVFIDCQGRSFKTQCSNVTVLAPRVYRKDIVTITNSVEFDFQRGNGTLVGARIEYRLNGSTSPLGSSHSVVGFQHPLQNAEGCAMLSGMTVVSDVAFDRIAVATCTSLSQSFAIAVENVTCVAGSALSGTMVTRAIVEMGNMTSTVVAMPGTASITIRDVRGPLACKGFGYTLYSTGAIASKIELSVTRFHNTLAAGTFSDAIGALSGTGIDSFDSFVVRENNNVRNAIYSFSGAIPSFDFAKLAVGNVFAVDLSAFGTITNAPPWQTGPGGFAIVEVLQSIGPSTLTKAIRVTAFGTTPRNQPKVWMSYDNATSWHEVGSAIPTVKTADFTVAAQETVLVNNKSGSACVVTLPSAATYPGRTIRIKTVQAQQVNSASSNVVPLAGGSAGTAILSNTAGKWADLTSDGTSWVIMAAN
jgi:hypothetical protein